MLVLILALACTYSSDPFANDSGVCGALAEGGEAGCSGAGCLAVLCAPDGFASCPEGGVEGPVVAPDSVVDELKRRCEDGGWNWEEVASGECPSAGIDDAVIVACMKTYPPG